MPARIAGMAATLRTPPMMRRISFTFSPKIEIKKEQF
jgi:hypothetical protein